MTREQLLTKCSEIAELIEPKFGDVEKFVYGYLDGGYINCGYPDLASYSVLMNVLMIVIDMWRPMIRQIKQEDLLKAIDSNEYVREMHKRLQEEVTRVVAYTLQESLNK